jgi:hypothetical protein
MLRAQFRDCRECPTVVFRPFGAGLVVGSDLGLKPQAESFRPFGTKRFAPFRPIAVSPLPVPPALRSLAD